MEFIFSKWKLEELNFIKFKNEILRNDFSGFYQDF